MRNTGLLSWLVSVCFVCNPEQIRKILRTLKFVIVEVFKIKFPTSRIPCLVSEGKGYVSMLLCL